VIKKNFYKLNKKNFLIIILLFLLSIFWLASSIDLKKIINSEVEGFQTKFTSFSSALQLFDSGDLSSGAGDIKSKDILPASKQLFLVLLDSLFKNKKDDLPEIKLFIKFKHLTKIYDDRNIATTQGFRYKSQYVPCNISDGDKTFKCKVKLKGDLPDHWSEKIRFSLRVKIKDGYIYGIQNFDIQKPKSRQFPYDQTFAKTHSDIGGLASNKQNFFNIKVNDNSWGVMNVEPRINDKFIELNEKKRLGVFRISNQDHWIYSSFTNNKSDKILKENHFISDPTIFFSQVGKESKILRSTVSREIYSNIFHSLSSKNFLIFDRKKMIDAFMHTLTWGNQHSLHNSNSYYVWNTYTHKLEPILTDQFNWDNIQDFLKSNNYLPYEYKGLFRNKPITKKEYFNSLKKINKYYSKNDPSGIANYISQNYFKNNRKKESLIIKHNIEFLIKNSEGIIQWINNSSSKINHLKKDIKNVLDYNFPDELNLNSTFLKLIHLSDGKIQIYNLLSQPIFVSEIFTDLERINVKQFIPASKRHNLSKIELDTNLIGIYDKKVKVRANFKDLEKIFSNDFSIMNKSYFVKSKNQANINICDYYKIKNYCYISGTHNISKNINFKKKVVIEKGSRLQLLNDSSLIFNFSVEMNGTKSQPIFISGKGSVIILNSNNSYQLSLIENVNFINLNPPLIPLMRFTGLINGYGGKFIINNSNIFNGQAEDQLNIVNAEIMISNMTFNNAKSDAFDCDYCKGKISNLKFNNIGGDAVDISGSAIDAQVLLINNAKDKAISIGENSTVNLKDLLIKNSGTGVAVKDGSKVNIEKIDFKNIFYDGFMTYKKKPYFLGTTDLNVNNAKGLNTIEGKICVREKETFAIIDGKICDESFVDVKKLYDEGRMKK
jgi:hypothetical protein